MLPKLSAVACSAALLAGLTATSLPAGAAAMPSRFVSVRATPGPGVGQLTISWQQDGRNTTGYEIETGLTSFSKTSSSLPRTGRNAKVFAVARTKRSITLTAGQLALAGAPAQSGLHLYFRVYAKNGSVVRRYPYLQAVMPKPLVPKSTGTALRVASFNVRTAKATTDARNWLERAPDVAAQIKAKAPGIVALQELSPGRADGVAGATNGKPRQTESLLTALQKVGAGRYKLTRVTPYIEPGKTHNTQGARILYDSSRYTMLSGCVDKTGTHNYSASCSIELPLLASDSESVRRTATYARFADRRTGKRFWVASVHLDDRHSTTVSKDKVFDALRKRQAATVANKMAALDTAGEPVVVAGDLNSWQNDKGGHSPHDYLVSRGYFDTAGAQVKVNLQYSTINHFERTQQPGAQGFGSRLDAIFVHGSTGAKRFENVTKVTDTARPSDHNIILSDLVL